MSFDAWWRWERAWRARAGVRPLDHPDLARAARVWRLVVHPEMSRDVVVTAVETPSGGRVELRAIAHSARDHADHDLGHPVPPAACPPTPRVWEASVSSDALETLAAQWPPLPPSADVPARWHGTTLVAESRLGGELRRRVTWRASAEGPASHDARSLALFALARGLFPDPDPQAALDPTELRPRYGTR